MTKLNKKKLRERRRERVRAVVIGTAEKPRLNVHRSSAHIFAQLIDDKNSKTLASAHSKKTAKIESVDRKGKSAIAYTVGREIAVKAEKLGIKTVVFDRAGYKYHGRVAAVADGAREGGLKF